MKKIITLLIVLPLFFMACLTPSENQASSSEVYSPQYNIFEENDWLSLSEVQLYQDESSLYLYISYYSERAGEYFIFNPPSGNVFKLSGTFIEGAGSILQAIDKDSLKGIEGITILLNQVNADDSTRVGLFIHREEIRLNQIPQKPESLSGTIVEIEEPAQEEQRHSVATVVEDTPSEIESSGVEPSVWSFYEISPDDEYNTELKITIQGLNVENLALYFDEGWTNEKNPAPVRTISPWVQGSDAIYRFNIGSDESDGRIGMVTFSDRNQNSRFDETPESEEISGFLLHVTPGKGNEYVINYITANVVLQVQGDLSRFNHPMFITNRFGRGSFPRRAFPISDSIEISMDVPTSYSKLGAFISTCEIFDDLNGDGIYDYRVEPVISNSIDINLDYPESADYVLEIQD